MNPDTPSAASGARRLDHRQRAALPDPLIGRSLGRYHILGAVGRGGASVVYLAEGPTTPQRTSEPPTPTIPHTTNTADAINAQTAAGADPHVNATPTPAERVALKVLTIPDELPDEEQYGLRMRFVRETGILERLRHPHILSVIEAAEADGYAYLVMPYVAGGTLARRLTVLRGPLPLDEVGAYVSQVAGALDAAHAIGVVHRDVKPSNILLDRDAHNVYLTDFGIASLTGAMARLMAPAADPMTLTLAGTTIGTPSYMAPEQITGDRVSPATDIYALGVVAYQLVTGQTPFQGETPLQVAVRQVSDPPRPPHQLRDDLPAPAEAAILRALAKAPADRFPTAAAFADAFAAGLRGEWAPGLDASTRGRRRQRLRLPWRARKPSAPTTPAPTSPTTTPMPPPAPTPTDGAQMVVGADHEAHAWSTSPAPPTLARRLALATAPLFAEFAQVTQIAEAAEIASITSTSVTAVTTVTTVTTMAAPTRWRRLGARVRRSLASALLALVAIALFGLAFAWALASFPTAPAVSAPGATSQRSLSGVSGGDQRLAPLPTAPATATPPSATTAVSFAVHGRYVSAYAANGALLWRFKAGGHLTSQPTLGAGVVYITTAHDAYTLRLSDGKLLTRHSQGKDGGDSEDGGDGGDGGD